MPAIFLIGVCGIAPASCAQQVSPFDLKVSSKVEVPMVRRSPVGGVGISDDGGNVYARLWGGVAGTQDRAASPIWKISPAGSMVQSFRILDAFPADATGKGIEVVGRDSFATADGRVFQTADAHGDTYVVEFAKDGSVKTKTKLVSDDLEQAWTWRLAVSQSGEFLLTASTGKDHLIPFTGIFATDGRLIKKIYEQEDDEARQKSLPADWSERAVDAIAGVDFVKRSGIATDSDGNFYLLHGTASPALVYVISPRGDVIRKLRIDAGDPGLLARSIKFHSGRLAIQFDKGIDQRTRESLIKVIDLQGNPIADYRVAVAASGSRSLFLAGYSSDGFTFVPYYNEDKLYLLKTKLP
jgi:hypothetical protein